MRGYRKKSEEMRIKMHGSTLVTLSFSCFLLFLILFPIGWALIPTRECLGTAKVFNWGVCTNCFDEQCLDCFQGPGICNTCKDGFREDKLTGNCIACDLDEVHKDSCKVCRAIND